MPLGDASPHVPALETLLSDTDKNQNAANKCDAACKVLLNNIAGCVNGVNAAIAAAPGDKATILALSSGGAAAIQAFMDGVAVQHTANKAAADDSLSF